MKLATICFCLRDNEVLLAAKKTNFGVGKFDGYGGGVMEGEAPAVAAARELREESSLIAFPRDMDEVAIIEFLFDNESKFKCHIYTVRIWQGEPVETEEMGPPRWYPLSRLPYEEMLPADSYWIPVVLLTGLRIDGQINYNADGTAVKEFHFQQRIFQP